MSESEKIRTVIADDERPARSFLASLLAAIEDVSIVGEASSGPEALEMIKDKKPDLAILDLQMPEMSGIDVVRRLRENELPLVVFATAYDEFAVQAFDVNAVDYLLKPIERKRLIASIVRVRERLSSLDTTVEAKSRLRAAVSVYEETNTQEFLSRIPVKSGSQITLVPVGHVASIVAEGELLHITTVGGARHIINYRLKDIEAKLDPAAFVRLSRGTLVSIGFIEKVSSIPGGTLLVTLRSGEEFTASRLQSRVLRETLLRL